MSELTGVEVRAPQRGAAAGRDPHARRPWGSWPTCSATFGARRDELLQARAERRKQISETGTLDFLAETQDVRDGEWTVAPAPVALQDRRVEITGPTDAKMAINALNSGARVWLADLEDANTPHWSNVIEGQVSLYDAHRHQLAFTSPEGKQYALNDGDLAVPVVRPRGWHFDEKHVLVDGQPDGGGVPRLRAALLPQRRGAAGARARAVLLPAEDGEPPRGAALERRLHPRAGRVSASRTAASAPPS